MRHSTRAALLKHVILLFWSVWITIVLVMNVCDALRVAGLLPADTPLASHNYDAIVDSAKVYGTPHWIDYLFFVGVIAWEAIAAALFWRALVHWRRHHAGRLRAAYLALTTLFGLFAAFILTDEIFHNFKIERDHRGIAVLLLVSVVAIHLLPEREER